MILNLTSLWVATSILAKAKLERSGELVLSAASARTGQGGEGWESEELSYTFSHGEGEEHSSVVPWGDDP